MNLQPLRNRLDRMPMLKALVPFAAGIVLSGYGSLPLWFLTGAFLLSGATALLIVIPRTEIVHTMHEAVERPETEGFGYGCFMSGPSKTADIEQALVFGAHGPMSVTVLLA